MSFLSSSLIGRFSGADNIYIDKAMLFIYVLATVRILRFDLWFRALPQMFCADNNRSAIKLLFSNIIIVLKLLLRKI